MTYATTVAAGLIGLMVIAVGVLIPPEECIISQDDFIKKVMNRRWASASVSDTYRPVYFKERFTSHTVFKLFENGTMQIRRVFWLSDTETCSKVRDEYDALNENKAVFSKALRGASNQMNIFMSSNPYKYLILLNCHLNSDDGENCSGFFSTTILIPEKFRCTEDILNVAVRFPYRRINRTLKKCLNQTLGPREKYRSRIQVDLHEECDKDPFFEFF